jgi:hypothetical protein
MNFFVDKIAKKTYFLTFNQRWAPPIEFCGFLLLVSLLLLMFLG